VLRQDADDLLKIGVVVTLGGAELRDREAGHGIKIGRQGRQGRQGATARLPPSAAHCRLLPPSSPRTPRPASPAPRRRASAALAPSLRAAPCTRRRTAAAPTDSPARWTAPPRRHRAAGTARSRPR